MPINLINVLMFMAEKKKIALCNCPPLTHLVRETLVQLHSTSARCAAPRSQLELCLFFPPMSFEHMSTSQIYR